ncbi:hypothetical protein HBB16_06190 [Pseudonocardia sp. MCCB 268]|nr:hypothetical protein [Pseudonocardia cytotoxica]
MALPLSDGAPAAARAADRAIAASTATRSAEREAAGAAPGDRRILPGDGDRAPGSALFS